jgi:hypothetical protein
MFGRSFFGFLRARHKMEEPMNEDNVQLNKNRLVDFIIEARAGQNKKLDEVFIDINIPSDVDLSTIPEEAFTLGCEWQLDNMLIEIGTGRFDEPGEPVNGCEVAKPAIGEDPARGDKEVHNNANEMKRIYPVSRMCFNDSEGYRTDILVGAPIDIPAFLLPLYNEHEFDDYLGPAYVETWYVFENKADADACLEKHWDGIIEPGDAPYYKLPEPNDEWNEVVQHKQSPPIDEMQAESDRGEANDMVNMG